MKNVALARALHRANVLTMKPRRPGRWPHDLGEPINAMDNTLIARAHSYLHGFVPDASGLSIQQARDVCAWSESTTRK